MEGRDKQLLQQSRAFDREIDRDIKTVFANILDGILHR